MLQNLRLLTSMSWQHCLQLERDSRNGSGLRRSLPSAGHESFEQLLVLSTRSSETILLGQRRDFHGFCIVIRERAQSKAAAWGTDTQIRIPVHLGSHFTAVQHAVAADTVLEQSPDLLIAPLASV